jgi:signal transduction histidine kinase
LDDQNRVTQADEPLTRWLDLSADDILGQPLGDLFKLETPQWAQPLHTLLTSPEAIAQATLERTLPNGGPVLSYQISRVRHPSGSVIRISSLLPPVQELAEASWDAYMDSESARREMFVRLLRTEAQLNGLMQRWPGIIFSQRPDCSFSFISPRIEEFTGVPANNWRYQPQLFWRVVHEGDADQIQKHLRQVVRAPNGLTITYRIRHTQTGRVAYILEHRQATLSSTGLLLGYDGFWLDITRQTIAEKRLSSSAWKETLAVLTMGLAHDFSNIMAGILSLSETFQAELGKDHPFYEGLTLIRDNSIQASQLIQRISQLHRGKPGERSYIDLNEMTGEMVDLVRKIVPKRISIQTRFATRQLPVYADAVEFRQVFVNLALNASDAMPQRGQIIVETSAHDQYPPLAHVQGALPKPPVICLTLQDTGCGIPEKNLAAIFDPFFTTKEVNKGSGLGLYNTRLFVEKHQGAISVDSRINEGTTFRIWLPQADFTEAERGAREIQARHTVLLIGSNGTALNSMTATLRQNGFCVVVTTSEANAGEFLTSPEYRFSAVILQTTVAQSALFRDIHQQHVSVKTILQIVQRNPDEVETQLLKWADLVLPADMSEPKMLERIKSVLDETPKTP